LLVDRVFTGERRPNVDEELTACVARARQEDRAAFSQLVAMIQDRAVAFAYGRLGDAEQARDVAQDALIDAYGHPAQLRDPRAFLSWFRAVAKAH
jgi:DNA-directed RNA polymerase specialized sigma24 family protein